MHNISKKMPLALLCLYSIKLSLGPINYPEVALILVLGLISAVFEYKSNDLKLSEIEEKLKEMQKSIDEKNKEVDGLKSSVASIKLSSGMRQLGNIK